VSRQISVGEFPKNPKVINFVDDLHSVEELKRNFGILMTPMGDPTGK
jgi:hypothetical protein